MAGVNVKSEIKPLKKVLLHRPGRELLNLTPNTLEELLFDDIPFLKVAQEEHDAFAQTLRDNGVEVVYLEKLMAEVLDQNPELREKFLKQFIEEAGIRTERYQKIIYDYLNDNYPDNYDLVLKTMEGINLTELHTDKSNSLVDLVSDSSKMVVAPMPNLYFTRDPFAMIGNGVSINRMYSVTRNRETIYGEYIFTYHPEFKDVPAVLQPLQHVPHRGRRHPQYQRHGVGHRHFAAHRARRHRRYRQEHLRGFHQSPSTPSLRSTSRTPARSCTSTRCSLRSTSTSSRCTRASWAL